MCLTFSQKLPKDMKWSGINKKRQSFGTQSHCPSAHGKRAPSIFGHHSLRIFVYLFFE